MMQSVRWRVGLALVEAVPKVETGAGVPLQARVGIATGLVVGGDLIGGGAAQKQAVVGETPNLAARLQALAEPDAVVIASSTRRLTGSLFEYRDLWTASLKGFIHLGEGETITPMLLARRFILNPVLVILALMFWYWMSVLTACHPGDGPR
jgi:hypothetical protein